MNVRIEGNKNDIYTKIHQTNLKIKFVWHFATRARNASSFLSIQNMHAKHRAQGNRDAYTKKCEKEMCKGKNCI